MSLPSAPAASPSPTLLDAIWESIVTPGAGPGLIATINGALLVLLAVCAYFAASGVVPTHLAVLAALAVGLLVSFNWFLSLVAANDARNAAAAGAEGGGVGVAKGAESAAATAAAESKASGAAAVLPASGGAVRRRL